MPEIKMNIYDFGKRLLETRDLDPVYIPLWKWKPDVSQDVFCSWLLAYWSYYHMGTASWIADGMTTGEELYWERFLTAARSSEYPRCHERRHYRGKNAEKSATWLREQGIGGLFSEFYRAGYELKATPADVLEYVQEWVGFGPWIAFKVADMLERLDIVPLRFYPEEVGLYDSPQEGAKRLWEREKKTDPPKNVGEWAINRVLSHLGDVLSPPRYERRINPQEAETILCKWKSYLNGKYEIGEDVLSCRRCLSRFSRKSPIARRLFEYGRGELW